MLYTILSHCLLTIDRFGVCHWSGCLEVNHRAHHFLSLPPDTTACNEQLHQRILKKKTSLGVVQVAEATPWDSKRATMVNTSSCDPNIISLQYVTDSSCLPLFIYFSPNCLFFCTSPWSHFPQILSQH